MRTARTGVLKLFPTLLGMACLSSCARDEVEEAETNASISEKVAQERIRCPFTRRRSNCFSKGIVTIVTMTKRRREAWICSPSHLISMVPNRFCDGRISWTVSRVAKCPEEKDASIHREITEMVGWVYFQLTAGDRELREVAQRRLNRIEYENTMHDLLGIDRRYSNNCCRKTRSCTALTTTVSPWPFRRST